MCIRPSSAPAAVRATTAVLDTIINLTPDGVSFTRSRRLTLQSKTAAVFIRFVACKDLLVSKTYFRCCCVELRVEEMR